MPSTNPTEGDKQVVANKKAIERLDCRSLYEIHCKDEFAELKDDIKCIKTAIVGNGKDGLVVKVDRNTRWINGVVKAMWVIVGLIGGFIVWFFKR